MNEDERHLQLLSIFHYVFGGIVAVCALFPIVHFIIGLFLILAPDPDSADADEAMMVGWLFLGISSFIILSGWILASLIIFAGRSITRRKRYYFCLVIAGIECVLMPVGTALGAFTIIVLVRESVKDLFDGKLPPADEPGESIDEDLALTESHK